MPNSPAGSPAPHDALQIHARLVANEPTASSDLAVAYLEPLVHWLVGTNKRIAFDICQDAAVDALVALIRKPDSYKPAKQTLEVYLRMSARGDLQNRLAKEKRHKKGQVTLTSVEHSPDAGKYLGRHDDPALPSRIAEESLEQSAVLDSVQHELSESDRRALDLIRQGERRTSAFVEVYALQHLPDDEQRRLVKQHKDRLKALLKRAARKT